MNEITSQQLETIRAKQGFICDMDGVIYHGNRVLDGVVEFIEWLQKSGKKFVFLTNSPEKTPQELSMKLGRMGLEVSPERFYTSAMATAAFLNSQKPGCTAYVIGEAALTKALYDQGIYMNDVNPDYVVVGETNNYNFAAIRKAVKLLQAGAKLIGTNTDLTGPDSDGAPIPACRALIAPIELATGKQAYFLGKPNPLMMRHGLNLLGCKEEDVAIIGDRMDTDIVAGVESEIDTALVLSGVTTKEDLDRFPYRPRYILNGIGEVIDH